MLQKGHSGDGCELVLTLCKYDLRKVDLFVLSWTRVWRGGKYLFRAANVWLRCAQYFVIAVCTHVIKWFMLLFQWTYVLVGQLNFECVQRRFTDYLHLAYIPLFCFDSCMVKNNTIIEKLPSIQDEPLP